MSNAVLPLILARLAGPATPAPTVAPAPASLAEQLAPIAFFGLAAIALLIVAWRLNAFRGRPHWSFPRCPTRASAGRLWIGLATMAMVFVLPSLIVGLRGGPPPTAAATQPTAAGDAVGLALMAGVYLVGLAVVAIVHAALGWHESLIALGLRDTTLIAQQIPTAPPAADAAAGRSLAYATPSLASPPTRLSPWLAAAIGALFAIAATFCASAITQVLWTAIGYSHESAHELLQLMQRVEQSPAILVLAILNAAVLAPVFEELMFRGHLQTAIASLTPGWRWPAILITSACFALLHTPWMMPPIFVLSVVIGYLFERTGRLWVAIATHVAFNATSTALFLATRGAM